MKKEIKSDVIRLRVVDKKNAEKILEYFNYDINKYLYEREYESIEEVNDYLDSKIEEMIDEDSYLYDIYNQEDDFVGQIEVINYQSLTPEVKLWIAKRYQHQGYGEASVEIIKNHLNEDGAFNYLIMEVDYRNYAALELVKKLGGMEIAASTITSQIGFTLELTTFIVKQIYL